MSVISLKHKDGHVDGCITLSGSKSISNRILIIRALCVQSFDIHHLSTSDDTSILNRLLSEDHEEYYVGHAGTTFRFLTAYLALKEGQQVLTGSSRMLERPIGPLVTALREIGCEIAYLGQEGYPPLQIGSPNFNHSGQSVSIDSGISSQYITALILIAPTLPGGLTIHLEGEMVSESYLQLTLGIVREFGIEVTYDGKTIQIAEQSYQAKDYTVEADWSACSYHFAIAALAEKATLKVKGLFENSLQGDAAIVNFGERIGVRSTWDGDGWLLEKVTPKRELKYDFINQPDIAQTLAVICAAKNIETEFSGLKTLRIKETDRISALDIELSKIGSSFKLLSTTEDGEEYYQAGANISMVTTPRFKTYKDHRMAMAFAPLALLAPIEISKPEVVTKSYTTFWEDLESLGFTITRIED